VLINGMTDRETTDLTLAMASSGDILDLSGVVEIAVDKHSTGGVGDKTTLVVEPIVAACGLPVGKMSGRGLGFSGGTLDKIESIPGYRTNLTTGEFLSQLANLGLVLTGQTGDLAPADGKLYALRDVTGTVQSIPLIASSIMSKKIAAGAMAIVLDVKVGNGAFMQTLDEAEALAKLMVSIARLANRNAVAVLSDMNQPLGFAVGNSLELNEAIKVLHGEGPNDFIEHCILIASQMLIIGNMVDTVEKARMKVKNAIVSGSAWEKFRSLVIAQGGDVSFIDNPEKLPKARILKTFLSAKKGCIKQLNARVVGEISVDLGAGRQKKGAPIDHSVGIEVFSKVGDWVEKGQPLFAIHANDDEKAERAMQVLSEAIVISETKVEPLPLFYSIVQ
jgi:pyrimidine-nucleoside phosphorylase